MKSGSQVALSSDARRAARKPMRTLAEILPEGHEQGLSCLVLDMSGTGAKLKIEGATRKAFAPAMQVPETFRLSIPRDSTKIDCRLAWRDKDTIGVTFTSSFKTGASKIGKAGVRRG